MLVLSLSNASKNFNLFFTPLSFPQFELTITANIFAVASYWMSSIDINCVLLLAPVCSQNWVAALLAAIPVYTLILSL